MYWTWLPPRPLASFMKLWIGDQLLHNIQVSPTEDLLWIASWLLRRCRILGKYKVQAQCKKGRREFRVERTVQTTERRWWGAGIQPSFFSSRCTWVRKHYEFIKIMGLPPLCNMQLIQSWKCFTVKRLLDASFVGTLVSNWGIHLFKSNIAVMQITNQLKSVLLLMVMAKVV